MTVAQRSYSQFEAGRASQYTIGTAKGANARKREMFWLRKEYFKKGK